MTVSDLSLAELLAARLCHDLVGPVGAVANGVELLSDGGRPDPEVLELVAGSARQASRRLQAFRVAFGTGNALPSSGILAEVRRLAVSLCPEGRIALEWPAPDARTEAAMTKPIARMMLTLAMLSYESLPRGGTVRVGIAAAEGRFRVTIGAHGTPASLPEEVRAPFASAAAEVTPRNVIAHLARLWADEAQGRVSFATEAEACRFELDLPIGMRPAAGSAG